MSCECDCNTESKSAPALRGMKLEFLYLDEAACAPCGETAQTLEAAAEAARLLSSPTIRMNVVDIDPAVTEDDCPSCGTLAGDDTKVNCRVWHWRGEVFSAAPVGKIVESLMAAATGGLPAADQSTAFTLLENLQRFLRARLRKMVLGCCTVGLDQGRSISTLHRKQQDCC